jgi:hypothetical protein
MASSGKYIPPALRAKMAAAAEAAREEEAVAAPAKPDLQSWLREARQGYVPKTAEQIRQESLLMNYEQLRSRAGPPPPVSSDDFGGVWEQGGEATGARVCGSFDEGLRLFKQGRGGPPAPLLFDGRDDGNVIGDGEGAEVYLGLSPAQQRRKAYRTWYEQWGDRLNYLWRAEHGLLATTKKLPPPLRAQRQEERKEPTQGQLAAAAAAVVCEKSGW